MDKRAVECCLLAWEGHCTQGWTRAEIICTDQTTKISSIVGEWADSEVLPLAGSLAVAGCLGIEDHIEGMACAHVLVDGPTPICEWIALIVLNWLLIESSKRTCRWEGDLLGESWWQLEGGSGGWIWSKSIIYIMKLLKTSKRLENLMWSDQLQRPANEGSSLILLIIQNEFDYT